MLTDMMDGCEHTHSGVLLRTKNTRGRGREREKEG